MKNTKICPKCKSNEIVRITPDKGLFGTRNTILSGVFSTVIITRYLCTSCGFMEEWIDCDDDVILLKKEYEKYQF